MKHFVILLTLALILTLAACAGAPQTTEAIVTPTVEATADMEFAQAPQVSPTPTATPENNAVLKESEHFKIYYFEEKESAVDELAAALEDNYERICTQLRVELNDKSDVWVYPDLETFHNAVGQPNAEDWVVGMFYNGALRIVSPDNPGPVHTYESIVEIVVHEFVHLAADSINHYAPPYLSEGLACYLAGQEQGVAETVTSFIESGSFPSLRRLDTMTPGQGAYQFGYAAVDYIISEYGWNGLLDLYAKPDIADTLKVSRDEFRNSWIAYLTAKYDDSFKNNEG